MSIHRLRRAARRRLTENGRWRGVAARFAAALVLAAPASMAVAQNPNNPGGSPQSTPPPDAWVADADGPPVTPEELRAARAAADRIIAAGRAAAAFKDVTSGRFPVVRHLASGAYCSFDLRLGGAITLGRGEAATCNEPSSDLNFVASVHRATAGATAASELAAAVAALRAQQPQLVPSRPPGGHADAPSGDPHAWLHSPDGKTYVMVADRLVNGWVYSARITGAADMMASIAVAAPAFVIRQMVDDPTPPPPKSHDDVGA